MVNIPTENELKFLLNVECENEIEKNSISQKDIRQGYLVFSKGVSLRIRETFSSKDHRPKFELTFKQKVGNRVIEIEKDIDHRDFNDLWEVSINKLEKIRYNIAHEENYWEVDAFKDHNHETYIIVAEHEMPEGKLYPESIPAIINDNLLYAVPLDDYRFSSKKLANLKYSKKLYKLYR